MKAWTSLGQPRVFPGQRMTSGEAAEFLGVEV